MTSIRTGRPEQRHEGLVTAGIRDVAGRAGVSVGGENHRHEQLVVQPMLVVRQPGPVRHTAPATMRESA